MEENRRVKIPKTIVLDDEFMIRADDYGMTLIRQGIAKSKKDGVEHEIVRVVGYFYDIETACKEYVRQIERIAVTERAVGSVKEMVDTLCREEERLARIASIVAREGLEKQAK